MPSTDLFDGVDDAALLAIDLDQAAAAARRHAFAGELSRRLADAHAPRLADDARSTSSTPPEQVEAEEAAAAAAELAAAAGRRPELTSGRHLRGLYTAPR